MASIHSTEENNFVADLIRQRLKSSEYLTRQRWYWCWIGATLNEFTKEFTWLDGTPWDFTNWRPGVRSCQDQLLKRSIVQVLSHIGWTIGQVGIANMIAHVLVWHSTPTEKINGLIWSVMQIIIRVYIRYNLIVCV